jgi:hypothetical protein
MPITVAMMMAQRKLDRRREQGQELGQHRPLGDERIAEIAVEQPPEIIEVLLPP